MIKYSYLQIRHKNTSHIAIIRHVCTSIPNDNIMSALLKQFHNLMTFCNPSATDYTLVFKYMK